MSHPQEFYEERAMKMTFGWKTVLALSIGYSLGFAQTVPTRIALTVVEGEGAVNNLRQRVAHDPVVRVEDENQKPLEGAAVVFTLPVSGASGEFSNGSKSLTVMTDKEGMASAHGLKTNQSPGKLQIFVTASYRGQRARTLINQFNIAASGAAQGHGGGSKVWIILAVAGAAAAGGAVAATHKGSSPATASPAAVTPQPIGISIGSSSIGPPH